MANSLQQPAPSPKASLITDATYQQQFTSHRECGAVTAALRGIHDYLQELKISLSGRDVRFERVFITVPEDEVEAQYPAAIVNCAEGGEYDYSNLTPRTFDLGVDAAGKRLVLRETAEVTLNILIGVRCTDPRMRTCVAAMLEDALDPFDWMAGFRILLPFYHGAVCTYVATDLTFHDEVDDAQRRWRDLDVHVTANLPKLRWVGRVPELKIELQDEVD